MPSVSSTDGGYHQYYNRLINELEAEHEGELKRAKDGRAEELNKMEDKYLHAMAEKEASAEEQIASYRATANDDLTREKQQVTSEMQKLKSQTYDSRGRYSEELQQQQKMAKQSLDGIDEKNAEIVKATEDSYDRRMNDQENRHSRELQKIAETSEKAAGAAYEKRASADREDYYGLREELQNKYNELNRDVNERATLDRALTRRKADDLEKNYQHLGTKLQSNSEDEIASIAANMAQQKESAVAETNRTHGRATSELREQVKDLLDHERLYGKNVNEGRAEAVKDYEDFWRSRERNTMDANAKDVGKLKQTLATVEDNSMAKNAERNRDKENYFTELLQKQAKEQRGQLKDLQANSDRSRTQLQKEAVKAKEAYERNMDNQREIASEQEEKTLLSQTNTFRENMGRQRQAADSQIRALEKTVVDQREGKDISLVSPQVENKIRDYVASEYKKDFDAEHLRNQRKIEHMETDSNHKYSDLLEATQSKERLLAQSNTAALDEERSRFGNFTTLNDANLRDKSENLTYTFERTNDNQNRNHARELEGQKMKYEEILQTARLENDAKINTARQEADLTLRLAQRDFAADRNRAARDFEKKTGELRDSYEFQLATAKADKDKVLHEADRDKRLALEEQQRNYEYQLRQAKAQHEEHQKTIAQNYEDQLDKIRNANARTKKS